MKLLAVETSAVTGSVAFSNGTEIIESFVNNGLNHSRTLLPMIDDVLTKAGVTAEEIDAFLCTSGPGSFTGVRIGVATVKGLAAAANKPCAGISTLLCMAYTAPDGLICCVMDARRGQFYHALFEKRGNVVTRLLPDCAEEGEKIALRLKETARPFTVTGDGTAAFLPFVKELPYAVLPGENGYQRASGILLAARSETLNFVSPEKLLPSYLRVPQAEREKLKQKGILL